MVLDLDVSVFIDKMGVDFERYGATRAMGRVFAYLLVHPGPTSLQVIARDLSFSRATASLTLRHAEAVGIATKMARPGDRQDYYQMTDGVWTDSILTQLEATVRWKVWVTDLLTAAPTLHGTARDRLQDMTDFFTFLGERFAHVERDFALWKEGRKGGSRSL